MNDLSSVLFLGAATLALIGVIAHELAGAAKVLGPLRESGLDDGIIGLHHFSWHVGSVAVVAMIALFLLAVLRPDGFAFAAVATAMSAGFAALGIGLASLSHNALWRTPAPYPWTLVTALGILALPRQIPSGPQGPISDFVAREGAKLSAAFARKLCTSPQADA